MVFFDQNFLTPQTSEFIPTLPPPDLFSIPDKFEVTYTIPSRTELTDTELISIKSDSVFVFDSESFINYSLIAFKHVDSGKYLIFEYPFNAGKLKWVMQHFLVIGFNSRTYDLPIISLALAGFNSRDLKEISNQIIFGRLFPYQVEQSYKIKIVKCNHIDLIEVAPLDGSLKLYAGRLHCKRMQELPLPADTVLTSEQKIQIKDYCLNDTDNTELLFNQLKPQLELRYSLSNTYNVDLRSKSDAQIAEAVISNELERLTARKPERTLSVPRYFYYIPPPPLKFSSPVFNELARTIRDTPFELDETGKVKLPEAISKYAVKFDDNTYRIGIGGLHSSEKQSRLTSERGILLFDRDVASYYPSIILNYELFPRHLGKPFLQVYRSIVEKRLTAKDTADKVTSDALKITINGTFGKLGNRYSILYSPELLIQVTISGQLFLLQLIDMLYTYGSENYIRVKSANTDGLLISCPEYAVQLMRKIISKWEKETGFKTEETAYQAIYSRDVNNYIGVKKDNSGIKVKGAYSERGSSGDSPLSRNPEAFICGDAIKQYLVNQTPIEKTIRECNDIRRFVFVRNVRGGAQKSDKYLGKTIRWYYSTEMHGNIRYVISGNKVPNTDGAMPLMELCESIPDDLDYRRYVNNAECILWDIGAISNKPLDYNDKFTNNFANYFER
jgi:hypothetical protein